MNKHSKCLKNILAHSKDAIDEGCYQWGHNSEQTRPPFPWMSRQALMSIVEEVERRCALVQFPAGSRGEASLGGRSVNTGLGEARQGATGVCGRRLFQAGGQRRGRDRVFRKWARPDGFKEQLKRRWLD